MKNRCKKVLSFLLSLVLVIGIFAGIPFTESPFKIFASAASSGTCGDNVTWTFDGAGTLTISGTGDMKDYLLLGAPWYSFKSSIKNVVIKSGVTSVGNASFFGCSLESIFIPKTVKPIKIMAFVYCNVENIYYEGTEDEGLVVFENFGGVCENAYFNCMFDGFRQKTDEVVLSFKILDNGSKFKGGTFFVNGTEYNTGNGIITIKRDDLREVNTLVVTDSANKYYDLFFNKNYLDDRSEILCLEIKKSDIKPYVDYVYCRNNTSGSKWKNAGGESITIPENSAEYFDVVIGATAQTGNIAKVCLAQDGAKTLKSDTGVFSNEQLSKTFVPGKDIIAYCVDTKGNVSKAYKTEIAITESDLTVEEIFNNGRIELFSTSGTSFKISDDVPFFGGIEMGLDFDSLPISVSVEGNKYKVAVGVDDETFSSDEWNIYKNTLKKVKQSNDQLEKAKKLKEVCEKYNFKKVSSKFIGGGNFDWNVGGFVEWEIINGEPIITDSFVGLSVDTSYKWNKMGLLLFLPFPFDLIPFYMEFGVGLSFSTGGTASRILADSDIPIEWNIHFKFEPEVSFEVGVGIPDTLCAGGGGKGKLSWYQEIPEMYRKIDLTLSAYVKAQAATLSCEKEFTKKTWNLWSGTYGSNSQNLNYEYSKDYLSSNSIDLFDADNYTTLADRSYVKDMTWLGGVNTPMLFSSRDISVSGYETSTLQSSIYSDSRQQLVEFDGGKMLVWITDDTTRESANRTELVYSLYDEATATWSAPVAVCDDGTADFMPDVVSDGNNVWVVWQNTNTTFTEETATLENYSAATEVCVSKYNGSTGEFETATTITDNSTVDLMPQITAENGNISVVWVNNDVNNYFGIEGVNTIMTSSFSGENWTQPKELKRGLTSVASIDCKLYDGNLYIVFSYEIDNDYNDISDREIYQLKISEDSVTETRLTENTALDSAPRYAEIDGNTNLVWYSEGNFNVLSNLDSTEISTVFAESVGATDIYSVAQSAGDITYIIWSQFVGEQVAFYGAIYNGAEWSEPVLLGETGDKVLNPSAVVDADGTMFVVYNNVIQETVTETIEEIGEDFTYCVDVQTDLALLKVYQNSNVSVYEENLTIEADEVFPGSKIPLALNVTNNGTTSVDSVDIYIDGKLNLTADVNLLPGQSTTVNINYTVPETVTQTTLSISAEPSASTDYDLLDNTVSVTYGYTELDVNDVTVYSTALKNTVTARICNTSAVDTGEFTVNVRANNEDGALVSTNTYSNLAAGDALFISQEFEKASMVYDEYGVNKYYIEVVTDSEEYSLGNNSGLAVFTEDSNSGVTSELLREVDNNDYIHAYGVIQNNEFAEHEVYAKIEVLDEAGNVIGLKFKKASLTDKQTYTLDENVYISGEYYETRLTLLDVGTEDISLRIPDGVTTIEELDFEACSDVVKLVVPESVETIGADAFSGCENLTVYCYPNSVAHTYAVDNSIPYVLYQLLGVGDTTIDTDNKFIFTDIYESHTLADFLTVSGYTAEIAPATENAKLYGTASTIDVYWEGELDSTYKLIVIGDTNGDSVCDILDVAQTELIANGHKGSTIEQIYAANGCVSDEIDVVSYQTVVNTALAN